MFSASLPHHSSLPSLRLGTQTPSSHRICTSIKLRAIVGIDLGTTNSALAYVGPDGPEVIKDAAGNATMPSVVTVTENDELFVGWAAVENAAGPLYTFSSFKRLMGHKYTEIISLADQLPYPVHEGDRGETLMYCAGADGMVTPIELSSWLLKYLVRNAELQLKQSVTGAVVTVPAHFDQNQRGATLEAAKMAGIPTVHLLQEPIAAALAYGIDGGTDGETVLVFDVGGGTFDVSVLQAFEGIMQVLGTAGDSKLGGDDVDVVLAEWILEKYGMEQEKEQKEGKSWEWALKAAREAKEALSANSSARVAPPPSKIAASTLSSLELNQELFESLNEAFFMRMAVVLEAIGKALFVEWAVPPRQAVPSVISLNSTAENENTSSSTDINSGNASSGDKWAPPPRRISRVALVGQITRLPSVRSFIERVAGVPPCNSVDPGAAVALGAATQAGILLGSVGSVELMDGSFVADLHDRVTGFGEWQP